MWETTGPLLRSCGGHAATGGQDVHRPWNAALVDTPLTVRLRLHVLTSGSGTLADALRTSLVARARGIRAVADRRVRVATITAALAYVLLRIWEFANVYPRTYPDTAVYDAMSRLPLTSSRLWLGEAPPLLPLFWKLLPAGYWVFTWRTLGQWIVSVLCWAALALALRPWFANRIPRWLAVTTILAFSLEPRITLWDGALLTESLAVSLGVALCAATLWFLRSTGLRSGAVVLGVAAAWSLERDINAYVSLAIILPAALIVAWRSDRRAGFVLALGALCVVFATVSLYSRSERQKGLLVDVVVQRVLDNPAELRYFVDRGMPQAELLRQMRVKPYPHGSPYLTDTRLIPFRRWMRQNGKRVYGGFLLSHPGYAFGAPLRDVTPLITPSVSIYAPEYAKPALPWLMRQAVFPTRPRFFELLLIGALLLVGFLHRVANRAWVVGISLVLSAVPHGLLVWHGDSAEVDRHALLVSILLRLGTWMLILLGIDALVTVTSQRSRGHARPFRKLEPRPSAVEPEPKLDEQC